MQRLALPIDPESTVQNVDYCRIPSATSSTKPEIFLKLSHVIRFVLCEAIRGHNMTVYTVESQNGAPRLTVQPENRSKSPYQRMYNQLYHRDGGAWWAAHTVHYLKPHDSHAHRWVNRQSIMAMKTFKDRMFRYEYVDSALQRLDALLSYMDDLEKRDSLMAVRENTASESDEEDCIVITDDHRGGHGVASAPANVADSTVVQPFAVVSAPELDKDDGGDNNHDVGTATKNTKKRSRAEMTRPSDANPVPDDALGSARTDDLYRGASSSASAAPPSTAAAVASVGREGNGQNNAAPTLPAPPAVNVTSQPLPVEADYRHPVGWIMVPMTLLQYQAYLMSFQH